MTGLGAFVEELYPHLTGRANKNPTPQWTSLTHPTSKKPSILKFRVIKLPKS